MFSLIGAAGTSAAFTAAADLAPCDCSTLSWIIMTFLYDFCFYSVMDMTWNGVSTKRKNQSWNYPTCIHVSCHARMVHSVCEVEDFSPFTSSTIISPYFGCPTVLKFICKKWLKRDICRNYLFVMLCHFIDHCLIYMYILSALMCRAVMSVSVCTLIHSVAQGGKVECVYVCLSQSNWEKLVLMGLYWMLGVISV